MYVCTKSRTATVLLRFQVQILRRPKSKEGKQTFVVGGPEWSD